MLGKIKRIVNWLWNFPIENHEYYCPRCKGKGKYKEHHFDIEGFSSCVSWNSVVVCERCKGTGRIDWVERVTRRIR